MRLATILAGLLAAIGVIAFGASGCGSSGGGEVSATAPLSAAASECPAPAGTSDLKAVGVDCGPAAAVVREWAGGSACRPSAGASRSSCKLGSWRCMTVSTARGTAVSCARAGRSIAFLSPH